MNDDLATQIQADADQPAHADPLIWFDAWLAEATDLEIKNANAMTLATVDPTGAPNARTVLLKARRDRAFAFYTNLGSAKAMEIASEAQVSLLFYWRELDRQIRIRGVAQPVSSQAADDYFSTRPRGSQLGAWASRQSEILSDRATLARRIGELERQFSETEIPRPDHWSGFAVTAKTMEFWQGRASRLHVRWSFTATTQGWTRPQQLFP